MKLIKICRFFSIFALLHLLAVAAVAQSLADYARQHQNPQAQASATPKLYTNEDISTGSKPEPLPSASPGKTNTASLQKEKDDKWKQKIPQLTQKIRQQKQVVHDLQAQIDHLNAELPSAGTVVVQYNQRQRQVQDQVSKLQQKLAGEQRKLEDMQESARKEGYGTAVYDPS